jgi:hypothetical protein
MKLSTTERPRPHATKTFETWKALQMLIKCQKVELNGQDLDIPTVVAVAKSVLKKCREMKS